MTFTQALHAACLASAKALGEDIKKLSWLLSNQSPAEHKANEQKAA